MMDFDAAKDFCETQYNMHLVFIETAQELEYMVNWISGRKIFTLCI